MYENYKGNFGPSRDAEEYRCVTDKNLIVTSFNAISSFRSSLKTRKAQGWGHHLSFTHLWQPSFNARVWACGFAMTS